MTNDQIQTIALKHGFKLKEQPDGSMGLNPYVFEFAKALLTAAPIPPAQEEEPVGYIHRPHGLVYAWDFSDELPVRNWIKVNHIWQYVYTRPANDKLRKAAEGILNTVHEGNLYSAPLPRHFWDALDNLRAALEGK